MTVRNVLRRPRTTSPLHWTRCRRCDRLIYAATIGSECYLCTEASEELWPGLGPVMGEIGGC